MWCNYQKMELFKLLVIGSFAIAAFPGQSFGDEVCRIGEELCGTRCFDPKIYSCSHNATLGTFTICRVNHSVCGSSSYRVSCYDPNIEVCYLPSNNSTRTEAVVCSKGQKACNTQYLTPTCYTPDYEICLDVKMVGSSQEHSIVCMKGQKLCDTTCYFPESYKCLNSTSASIG